MEMNQEQMKQANGGSRLHMDGTEEARCSHDRKSKTGNEREDSRFFFWSQHQYEYRCRDCGETIWVDEEREINRIA